MMILTPERFEEFFSALHGYSPFPWQKRLAAQVLSGRWPRTVKLPTASGKTAMIDVWVYALAAQAYLSPAERTTPRRMAFVVDRRVIVDEAYKRAVKVAERLAKAEDGILKEVADALRKLAAPDSTVPLQCFQLRGGMYRDDDWARTPTQPTLITSTVDQIGSRLLFRSYGFVKGFTYPIHAGLTAFDMLIVLDEAHCSKPFYQTADAIERYRRCATTDKPLPGPFRFVSMTATPPMEAGQPFELDDEDRNHEILSRRLNASKPTLLLPPVGDATTDDESKLRQALVNALVEQARLLAGKGLKAIGIMVNRVATAKAVHDALATNGYKSLLLIGRMRPFDRDLVQRDPDFEQLLADKSESRQLTEPVFVVATQTLEVGANLDFDGLVSECASLDALRQRFGRLNRMGRNIPAEGVIVIRADDADPKQRKDAPDPVYGLAMVETWQWLNSLDGKLAGKAQGGKKSKATKGEKRVDFGITAFQPHLDALDEATLNSLIQDSLNAPVMLPAHLDAWAQTSPMPTPTPDVATFLHGPERGQPEVQLIWRADLPELNKQNEDLCIDTVALCPPTSVEALPAPLYLVKQWLRKSHSLDEKLADVESIESVTDLDSDQRGRHVLIWRGPRKDRRRRRRSDDKGLESCITDNPNDILPGDTVILPADYSGWEIFGHMPNSEQPDIAEAACFQARRQLIFRLHPRLLDYLPDGPARNTLLEAAYAEEKPDLDEIKAAFVELAQSGPEHLRPLFAALAEAKLKAEEYPTRDEQPAPGWVITGRLASGSTEAESTPAEEDDELSLRGLVTLADHVNGVTELAVHYAQQCGLPDEMVADFRLAGQFHDAGKADPRFQSWLYGCMNRRYVRGRDELIAKSNPVSESRTWEAKTESGYPDGSRHELLSVSLIQDNPQLKARAHDWDLVLHLIASHHGRCRPFAPVVDDPEPAYVEVELYGCMLTGTTRTGLERLDSGIAERFWRLIRKYGWWGLAYLEAIFRLADHRQSEKDTGR
ncbi:MAG: type I-U CRISPR-associated helicase/endonuclease Cas3 [Anaerolineae bacterium]|nr:type I-U CRISPR-associated helicase/endonuclease Cas3 [Anaerolineae bacterium]